MKTKIKIILILVVISTNIYAQVSYEAGPTNTQINSTIQSEGVIVSGGSLNAGDRSQQIALFTGGKDAGLELDEGIFFGTGKNSNLLGFTNRNIQNSDNISSSLYYDPDLTAIDDRAIYDVVSYSFDVTIAENTSKLIITYQFGSEEYPDYVGSQYNDIFGFFVTGPGIDGVANLAKLPNGNPTRVNNVNYGKKGYAANIYNEEADLSQSELYINNGHSTNTDGNNYIVENTNPGPFPVKVEFNGITKAISFSIPDLIPGGKYTFKIAIADVGDQGLDSGVFISSISATSDIIAKNDDYISIPGGTTASVLLNDLYNNVVANTSNISLSAVTVPTGFTLNCDGTITVGSGVIPGSYELIYKICDLDNPNICSTAIATITVKNYWIGEIDNDWEKEDNWVANYVPDTGEDIEFATVANNGPTGNGNGLGAAKSDLHLDRDRIIGDLINKSDKDLIVTTENQLIINGEVRSDNTGGIVVNADPNKASGTLLFKKPFFNSNVDATVQFYNKAFECADCGFYRKQWQYFGVPVKSAKFPFADVTGTETVNRWDETYNGDKWRPTTGALSAFVGYQITNDAKTEPTEVYNFKGKLNVGDASVALTKTANVNYSGINLVSNSYTAAIPISTDAMTFPSDAEQTVYLFNTGTRDQWRKLNGQAINQDGYRSGQYLAVPVNLGGQGNFPDRIPSTHAFLLQTTASGTLNINYSKLIKNTAVNRGDGTQIVTRSVDSNNNTSTSEQVSAIQQLPSLVMDVIGEESADRVWIFQQSSATHDFDNGLDGRKLLEDGIAQLYVNAADDSKLQVATVPELKDVTLGFVPDRDGKFTLDFLMSGQLKGVDIYLYDSLNDTTTKVGDGQSYSFSAKKGDSQNRFSLTSSAKNAFLSIDESLLEVTSTTGGKIMVVNNSSKVLSALVYDSNGAFVQRVEVDANGKATIKDGLIKGMYMVRLQNSEVNDVRRVIVE